jgi:hypothetical protein
MTSQLELFRAMREALDDVRERTIAIEGAVARTQIYCDHGAMLEAVAHLRALLLAASSLQAKLVQYRSEACAAQVPTTQEGRRRRSNKRGQSKGAPTLNALTPETNGKGPLSGTLS